MQKFIQYLQEAQKIIRTSDHIIYVSYPLIKDKKILLKILEELKKAVAFCINAILQYDYLFKRIRLSQEPKTNLQIFITKSSERYKITKQEVKGILELFELAETHKNSAMEIFKEDKVVILSENMKKNLVSFEKTKEFLTLAKSILQKTQNQIIK